MATVVAQLVAGATLQEAATRAEVPPAKVRNWKAGNETFNRMLESAQERATNAIIDEGVEHVLQRIKGLGPRAYEVMAESLGSHDERLRLQAAQAVLRIGGVGKHATAAKPGLEAEIAALGNAQRPESD